MACASRSTAALPAVKFKFTGTLPAQAMARLAMCAPAPGGSSGPKDPVIIVAGTYASGPIADIGYAPLAARLRADGYRVTIWDLPNLGLGHIADTAGHLAIAEMMTYVDHSTEAELEHAFEARTRVPGVGQALADDPRVLLCDEPLTSLDLANQQAVVALIDRQRQERNASVLLVTHDINPVLDRVDRILYIVGGRFTLGAPEEVLRSEVLTDLYGAPVFVLQAGDRLVVVGAPDAEESHHHHDEDHR